MTKPAAARPEGIRRKSGQNPEDRTRKTGTWKKKIGMTETGRQKTEDRNRKTENGRQEPEDRNRDDRNRMTKTGRHSPKDITNCIQ